MPARALPILALLSVGAVTAGSAAATGQLPLREPVVTLAQADSDNGDTEFELRPSTVRVLTPADHDLFTRAFTAAAKGDWPQALTLARMGQNPTARQIVEWRYLLDRNAKAAFGEVDSFLKDNPDWPKRATLLIRAEEALDAPPAQVIAWYGTRTPASSLGMIRLGEAMIASGKTAAGQRLIRDGWVGGSFDSDIEQAIIAKDGSLFTPEIEKRRLDLLLWGEQITAARRQLQRVDEISVKLANARIALRGDSKRAQKLINELPAEAASDGALLFDQARAARKTNDFDRACELLLRPQVRELFKTHPGPLWAESHIIAREMMKQGHYDLAARLVTDTGLKSGNEFSDAEFLSGWIALRFLKDAPGALPHFLKLADGVSRPISKARAYYWQGRTYEVLSDPANAYKAYAAAAAFPETFYGELALTRIEDEPKLKLTSAKADPGPAAAVFERDDLVKAMRVLADLGAQDYLRVFALRYLELHPAHAYKLLQALVDMGYRDAALRVAKTIGYDGPTFPAYAYPVIPVPDYRGPGTAPEPALVHAIIRQETEFDPESVSHANARGIMQLTLPAAKVNAKRAGLPYRPSALTTDVPYNMQLGMTEFSGYLSNWDNSVIVSAAAYNAGATNAKRWIDVFGDPRSNADPIDWIESITYGETRNYVQRIVENLQVYRSRIAGKAAPLQILADLYAPQQAPSAKALRPPPPPKPVLRPEPAPAKKRKRLF